MKRFLLVVSVFAMVYSQPASAEPSPEVRTMMRTPATVFDVFMAELEDEYRSSVEFWNNNEKLGWGMHIMTGQYTRQDMEYKAAFRENRIPVDPPFPSLEAGRGIFVRMNGISYDFEQDLIEIDFNINISLESRSEQDELLEDRMIAMEYIALSLYSEFRDLIMSTRIRWGWQNSDLNEIDAKEYLASRVRLVSYNHVENAKRNRLAIQEIVIGVDGGVTYAKNWFRERDM